MLSRCGTGCGARGKFRKWNAGGLGKPTPGWVRPAQALRSRAAWSNAPESAGPRTEIAAVERRTARAPKSRKGPGAQAAPGLGIEERNLDYPAPFAALHPSWGKRGNEPNVAGERESRHGEALASRAV